MWKNHREGRVSLGAGAGKSAPPQGAPVWKSRKRQLILFLVNAADTRNSGKQAFGYVFN